MTGVMACMQVASDYHRRMEGFTMVLEKGVYMLFRGEVCNLSTTSPSWRNARAGRERSHDCCNKIVYIARRDVMHNVTVSPDGFQAQIMDVGTGKDLHLLN